jgi:hypothetical protein
VRVCHQTEPVRSSTNSDKLSDSPKPGWNLTPKKFPKTGTRTRPHTRKLMIRCPCLAASDCEAGTSRRRRGTPGVVVGQGTRRRVLGHGPPEPGGQVLPQISGFLFSTICGIHAPERLFPFPHRLLHALSVSGGWAMTFEEILDQALAMLQRRAPAGTRRADHRGWTPGPPGALARDLRRLRPGARTGRPRCRWPSRCGASVRTSTPTR